jgi:hypothetical protein
VVSRLNAVGFGGGDSPSIAGLERRSQLFLMMGCGPVSGTIVTEAPHVRRAALTIHRELLREVGGAVGVGHGARRQQQQLAEVASVQRQARYFFGGKMLAPIGLRSGLGAGRKGSEFLPRLRHLQRHGQDGSVRDDQRKRCLPLLA